jgi:Ca2+-binding EF-hand superfamily protein
MGCFCSKHFVPNQAIEGQGYDVRKLEHVIGFTDGDIDKRYAYFCKVDIDDSKEISVDEFIVMNGFSQDYLATLVFNLMDRNRDRRLNFSEFIVSLWNFSSQGREDMIKFFFQIYDADLSGELSKEEVKHMVAVIWNFNVDKRLKVVMDEFDNNGDKRISLKELQHTSRRFETMFFPAFDMQLALRTATLGEDRWEEINAIRKKKFGDKDGFEILREYGYKRAELVRNAIQIVADKSQLPCATLDRTFSDGFENRFVYDEKGDIGKGKKTKGKKNDDDTSVPKTDNSHNTSGTEGAKGNKAGGGHKKVHVDL